MRRSWNSLLRLLLALCLVITLAGAEPADWIYTARYVVTMDPQRRLIEDGAVAIRGERIVGVGTRAAIERQFQAQHRLDRPPCRCCAALPTI
jgi:5-methylthioadenosine/S-adenosylhomocysteine deaminase